MTPDRTRQAAARGTVLAPCLVPPCRELGSVCEQGCCPGRTAPSSGSLEDGGEAGSGWEGHVALCPLGPSQLRGRLVKPCRVIMVLLPRGQRGRSHPRGASRSHAKPVLWPGALGEMRLLQLPCPALPCVAVGAPFALPRRTRFALMPFQDVPAGLGVLRVPGYHSFQRDAPQALGRALGGKVLGWK